MVAVVHEEYFDVQFELFCDQFPSGPIVYESIVLIQHFLMSKIVLNDECSTYVYVLYTTSIQYYTFEYLSFIFWMIAAISMILTCIHRSKLDS